jgi:hypothetical protein
VTIRRLELALDLAQVPADPIDTAVHIGRGETPGLADLPDEEEGEQLVVLAQGINRSGLPGTGKRDIWSTKLNSRASPERSLHTWPPHRGVSVQPRCLTDNPCVQRSYNGRQGCEHRRAWRSTAIWSGEARGEHLVPDSGSGKLCLPG